MLIKINELIQHFNIKITGILHIGAHECEELNDYNNAGVDNQNIYWIGVDWGITHLRCYALNDEGNLLDSASSKDGISKIKTARNSNLPIIIAADNIHLAWSGNELKLPKGPISLLKPGPTTAIDVAAAENEVNKSSPIEYRIAAIIKTETTNKKIKDKIDKVVLSSINALEYVILTIW